jgi:hypothetical protein
MSNTNAPAIVSPAGRETTQSGRYVYNERTLPVKHKRSPIQDVNTIMHRRQVQFQTDSLKPMAPPNEVHMSFAADKLVR